MNITNDRPVMIFRREYQDKVFYNVGLSKKNKDGSYTNGYMSVQFKNDVSLNDKTKIKIKNAWLTFYLKDSETKPYIFINDFEVVDEVNNLKTKTEVQQQFDYTDEDLPF